MPAYKNILALDVATVTGWAWSDGEQLEHGVWSLGCSQSEHSGKTLERLEAEIYRVLERWPVDLIAFEDLSVGSIGFKAAYSRGKMGGVVEMTAAKNDIPIKPCPISTVKKFATGTGAATKPEMIHAARCILKRNVTDDNEADALWVLAYARYDVDEEVQQRQVRKSAPREEQGVMF